MLLMASNKTNEPVKYANSDDRQSIFPVSWVYIKSVSVFLHSERWKWDLMLQLISKTLFNNWKMNSFECFVDAQL